MITITKRCQKALKLICDSTGFITVKQVAAELDISERTARYDMTLLGDWLRENNLNLISVPKKGIALAAEDKVAVAKLFSISPTEESRRMMYLNATERTHSIIEMILEGKKVNNIDSVAEELGVSRTTLLRDLDKVERWFANHGVKLKRKQKKWVFFDDHETVRRRLIVDYIIENSDEENILKNSVFQGAPYAKLSRLSHDDSYLSRILDATDFEKVLDFLDEVFLQTQQEISDNAAIWLLYYVAVMLSRIRQNHYIDYIPERYRYLLETDSCRFVVDKLTTSFGNMPETICCNEAVYILARLCASTKAVAYHLDQNTEDLTAQIYDHILTRIHSDTGCQIDRAQGLADAFRTHLQAAVARSVFGMPTKNAILDDIRKRYEALFTMCKDIAAEIADEFDIAFDDNEVGYITMYIASELENIQGTPRKTRSVRALVICGYGVGTVTFLTRALAKEFPSIQMIGKLSAFEIEKYDFSDVDLILTTVTIPVLLPKPVIKVSPMLSKLDVRRIASFLCTDGMLQFIIPQEAQVNELVEIIKESCEIRDMQKLVLDLYKAMDAFSSISTTVSVLPTLQEIMQPKFIVARAGAETWAEAVAVATQPLMESGCIDGTFAQEVYEIKEKYNQYSIISPGICMPHASPNPDNKLAISLVTLENPVEVDVEGERIQLKVFMALSLNDTVSHAKALDEIFTLLDEFPDIADALAEATSSTDLRRIFNHYYNKLF